MSDREIVAVWLLIMIVAYNYFNWRGRQRTGKQRGGWNCQHGETEYIGGKETCVWCGK